MDDMLVKSAKETLHPNDLQETFDMLRHTTWSWTQTSVPMGFIGEVPWIHGLTEGVEANPDKIQAILSMEPPQNVKEVQSLTRWVTSLNKFVSKATDKCLPFFKVLKESIRMGGRVSKSIWRPQGISHNNSFAEPIQAKWRTIPQLSSLSSRSKFCLSQRRREGT